MANNENLKPFNEMSEEQHKKISSKGGKASGKSKREKKRFKECLETILDQEEFDEVTEKTITGYERISYKLYREAAYRGDLKAVKIMLGILDEGKKE